MQFLSIDENTKLSDLSEEFGSSLEQFLHLNGISRTPNVGKAFIQKCNESIQSTQPVSYERRVSLVSTLTEDSDIFERASLMSEDGWKLFDSMNTLPGMMKVPSSVIIPDSTRVIGNGEPVKSEIYNKVISCLKQKTSVDPSIFNTYSSSSSRPSMSAGVIASATGTGPMAWFPIPWGEVTLYSSLDNSRIEFPVFPDELSDSRKANYTTMPDMLYQYEPWQVYQSSGPRTQTYSFTFHRDMWSGDHTDGRANELIRACEANCYPDFKGSAVDTSLVTLYIHGQVAIRGVLTDVNVNWSGPLGHDMWWLICKLDLAITEVSEEPLNFYSVKNKPLVG